MSDLGDESTFEDKYHTVSRTSEGQYKDKGSKFFYFAYPVKTEEEIKIHLGDLRKKYFDARHHCFAWMLGKNGDQFRANDDGEPNHSAGDPILGQIRSNTLTNILIVVVRYFGGTKLGMGGLIQAYKTSAALAIEENEIVEEQVKTSVSIHFPYPVMNDVMKLIKSYDLQIVSQEMALDCQMKLEFRKGLEELIVHSLEEIENLELTIG
ncbi:putative YigZ family protein [Algoriphagus ratkowskyi]|uniref:YigZ family protein n=1 Tax=Algoriphagus ratkowskyi TaxID=57028 RepID=A0A2W7RE83_9BACT|nr:YigZ family protein [Algoriphagus ratkowskyi]PZX59258.1 putative YigZ family protein [Algoriphagus ratkowskyi]TXD77467.1 YigZ family protein [Algoriphagus ratkowskyi]